MSIMTWVKPVLMYYSMMFLISDETCSGKTSMERVRMVHAVLGPSQFLPSLKLTWVLQRGLGESLRGPWIAFCHHREGLDGNGTGQSVSQEPYKRSEMENKLVFW